MATAAILCTACRVPLPAPCAANPLIAGRWRCAQCGDTDLCPACALASPHVHNHSFLHLTSPVPSFLTGLVFVNPSMITPAPPKLAHRGPVVPGASSAAFPFAQHVPVPL